VRLALIVGRVILNHLIVYFQPEYGFQV